MKFLRDTPIKRKLFWVTLTTCGTAVVLSCAALFWFETTKFRSGFVAELESLGAIIAQNSAAPLAFDDKKSALEVLSALRVKTHITSATIFDPQGKKFAHYGTDAEQPHSQPASTVGIVSFHEGHAHLRLPIRLPDALPGHLHLSAEFHEQVGKLQSLYALVLAAVLVGSLVVILVISSVMQRIITVPIAALATAARNVREKEDYVTRAPETGRDEVGVLTSAFNQMLDQIQSRDQKLRESQQRYEVAVQGSSDGLWDWDLESNVMFFSPRWKSMLGYGEAELSNSLDTFRRLIHPDDIERLQAACDAYLAGDQATYEVEFRARCKDGQYRWILTRGAALRNEKGKAVRFAGSHTDITDRKRAEEAVLAAQAKFESLLNSIHGIVWESDPVDLRILYISDQAEVMLGYPARSWRQDPEFRLKCIHPDDRSSTIEACRRGIADGRPFQLEYRVTAADGRTVWLSESVSVERDGDRPVRLRSVALDVTAQKLAAEEITRMQRELVESSRMAGMAEVATGVLHNVGNVLNSVNVSTTLLVDQIKKSRTFSLAKAVQLLGAHKHDVGEFLTQDPKGKQLPAFLEAVSEQLTREQVILSRETEGLQKNVEHIKQIVAMQQSYAKVCGAMENLTLHELIEDALRLSSTALVRHQIELVREFAPVPPVLIDRHKVLQILVNLISNAKHALDARATGRRLVLRISRREPNRVRVEVIDNGAGIAPENLTRVFQHGFTTKKSGHGFGLHSGANAAKEMGGSLNAHSDGLGHGATFVLEFPVSKNLARRTAPPFINTMPPLVLTST